MGFREREEVMPMTTGMEMEAEAVLLEISDMKQAKRQAMAITGRPGER